MASETIITEVQSLSSDTSVVATKERKHSTHADSMEPAGQENGEGKTVPASRSARSSGVSRSSSLFSANGGWSKEVPIVELSLEGVWYEPITNSIAAASAAKTLKKATKAEGKVTRTTVLSNVSTKVAPYQLTAWMGPSGSGKTSLTSVVGGLVDPSDVTRGVIRVNGDVGRLPKRYVGVVWQDDLLLSNLTVEETIYFAARLKTPFDVSDTQVQELVEEVMEELGLMHARDSLIGSPLANVPGVSGGERKRTAVAAELVVRPSLLLLDEPTSGLDATTASALMLTLKNLAINGGHSIVTVIHQPRTSIFKLLDHLLLLSKGRVLYDGPACSARQWLESCPSVDRLPPETGIADWIMDTVIADELLLKASIKNQMSDDGTSGEVTGLAHFWASKNIGSSQKPQGRPSASTGNQPHRRLSSLHQLEEIPRKFAVPFWKQMSMLLSRTFKQRRGEKFTAATVLLTLCYTAFTSLIWWRQPDTTAYVFPRVSVLFFFLIAQGNSIVVSSMTVFQQERALLSRERAKKMYGVFPYFLAKTTSDMTNNILLPMCYGVVCYFTTNLRPGVGSFFKFVIALYTTLSTAQSMGLFLSSLIPNIQLGLILAPATTLFFCIVGGFYIPLADMNAGIKWASYISFARYGYSALLLNEFSDREIPCAPEGTVSVSIGDSSTMCPMIGDSVYEDLGLEGIFTNFWFNVFMVVVLDACFRVGAYGLLLRSK